MPDQKRPVDRLLDVVLYAPLGFVMNLEEVIPQLIEKGHQQVSMARMFGQFAVKAGSDEARKRVDQVSGQVDALVNRRPPAGERDASPSATPTPTSTPTATATLAPDADGHAGAAAPSAGAAASVSTASVSNASVSTASVSTAPAPESGTLAITDYDALSASQVVPRLAGLLATELDAVRLYEVANRGRKTILSKIAQLQG